MQEPREISLLPISGERFRRLRAAAEGAGGSLAAAVLGSYDAWAGQSDTVLKYYPSLRTTEQSTVLFDAAAAFLALHPDGGGLIRLEEGRIAVDPCGLTRLTTGEDASPPVVFASGWATGDGEGGQGGVEAFSEHLVQRLLCSPLSGSAKAARGLRQQ